MATNVLGTVYETLLCSPGMSEQVRVDVKISRKNILLLDAIIEQATAGNSGSGLIGIASKETAEELLLLSAEFLKKAGLVELSEKMKTLATK